MIAMLVLCAMLAQDYEKLAPYAGVRWVDGAPEVEIGGAWVALLEIDGVAAPDIVAFAKKTWPRIWRKRFEEDLVEVLSKMGKPPGGTVTLKVRDGCKDRVIEKVAMTKENRKRIWEAARERVDEAPAATISRAHAAADLDELKKLIDERYSYATRRDVKIDAAIDASKRRLPEQSSQRAFALEVQRILALYQDGHTGVEGEPFAEGYLPFLVAEVGGRVVAIREDRESLFDNERPYVKSIDGVEIAKWLEAAGKLSSLPARRARTLRFVRQLRLELGLTEKGPLKIELVSEKGESKVVEGPVSPLKPIYGEWPRKASRVLDGNVGYLRLASMDDEAVAEVGRAMGEFRKTAGLVIDVRGNGGGSRAALRALFPYFMKAGDAPRVVNVAASRVAGSLEDRWLFPAEALGDAERESIRKLAFKPEWTPPADRFGAWHYFVLSPGGAPFHYDRPVVVLMDGDCFSATDIFLGAFKGWRNVTLLGSRSGGGSGRAREYALTASGVKVRLSSMASFQSDGRLYDGRGVEPDVEALPVASDFTDRTDTVLEVALKRLRR